MHHPHDDVVVVSRVPTCGVPEMAGDTVLRICVVNPRTTVADIELIVDSLA